MEFLAVLAIVYFFIGAGVCLLICVNPNDTGILAALNRLVFRKIPSIFSNIVRRIFGQSVLNFLGGIKHYLMQTNHPIVQIFYLLIAVGGFIGYSITGIFTFMPNQYVGNMHIIIANVLAILCFYVYYKACSVSPGQLKLSNAKKMISKYESYYDDVMYRKDNQCKTCKINKPARSKHCSICGICVSKYDHHCVWIRQCVGQKNYKYFVSFLFLHAIWCLYLSIIGALSLIVYLDNIKIWQQSVRMGSQVMKVNFFIVIQYLLITHTLFFFLIFMCGIMGSTLLIFVTYHFSLIAAGQTTNERVKKNDQIQHLKKQLKNLTKVQESYEYKLPKQLEYKKTLIKKQQFYQYKEDTNHKLAILQKKMTNLGFFKNLKIIFAQSDNNQQ